MLVLPHSGQTRSSRFVSGSFRDDPLNQPKRWKLTVRLEINVPNNLVLTSRFCWVCGKIGTEEYNRLICRRHEEGDVIWNVYQIPTVRLNDAIVYRSKTIPVVDHQSPNAIGSPALCMRDGSILTDA